MRCEEAQRKRLGARVTDHPCLPGTVQTFALKFLHAEQPLSLGKAGRATGHPAVFRLALLFPELTVSLSSAFMLSL